MAHRIGDVRNVRLNARAEPNAKKIHAREIRIDQQRVPFEFELVAVRAEISHTDTVARRPGRIGDDQVRIRREACPKRVGRESQEKNERVFQVFAYRAKSKFRATQ